MNTFPNNLKRLRRDRDLKQEDLADRLNVTRQTVSGWETGRRQPDLDTLKQLAEALDADISELIYGEKPGEYPKFQRKFVTRCWSFGVTVVLLLMFWLFVMPALKVARNTTYDLRYYSMVYIVPVLGWFSAGALIPSGLALVYPVKLPGRAGKILKIVGTVLVLPGLLAGLDFFLMPYLPDSYGMPFLTLFYSFIVRASGRVFLLMMLPFLSGLLLFLGLSEE